MSDDPKKTGQDRKRISLSEPHEVRSWTEALGKRLYGRLPDCKNSCV